MKIGERALLDEIHGGSVVGFGFARETGDDVGTDGGVGELFTDEIDAAGVVCGAVPTVHGGEDAVGSRLQRHVEMFGEAWRLGKECDHIASNVERLDGTEAQARDGSFIENLAKEFEKILAGRKITAPGAEIDAAQNDFFVAGIGEAANFVEDGFRCQATAFSADNGDDAEAAAVVAAVLDFQNGTSVIPFAAEDGRNEDIVVLKDVSDHDLGSR